MAQLSYSDVKTLAQEPSPEVRGLLASKIAADYRSSHFSRSEEELAIDIFRLLLKDAEIKIRISIAQQLAHCVNAPHDIIMKLSQDTAEVSVPVLKYSSVLTEEDLVAIVHSTQEVIKLCAIADREIVPQTVTQQLVAKSSPMVLQTLYKNRGAAISAEQILQSWEMVVSNAVLMEALVERGGLPLHIAEKIYHVATESLRETLAKQYKLNANNIHKAAIDAKEWAVLGLMPGGDPIDVENEEQVEDFVDSLHFNGRLTHSLLMRSLCTGHMGIFECGIAKMANVPRANARILLMEASGRGLEGIYRAASMPEGFFEAVKVLMRISLEETDYGRNYRADFRKRVIERIYKEKYNRTVENMEYLLSIIGGKNMVGANVN